MVVVFFVVACCYFQMHKETPFWLDPVFCDKFKDLPIARAWHASIHFDCCSRPLCGYSFLNALVGSFSMLFISEAIPASLSCSYWRENEASTIIGPFLVANWQKTFPCTKVNCVSSVFFLYNVSNDTMMSLPQDQGNLDYYYDINAGVVCGGFISLEQDFLDGLIDSNFTSLSSKEQHSRATPHTGCISSSTTISCTILYYTTSS